MGPTKKPPQWILTTSRPAEKTNVSANPPSVPTSVTPCMEASGRRMIKTLTVHSLRYLRLKKQEQEVLPCWHKLPSLSARSCSSEPRCQYNPARLRNSMNSTG